NRVERAAIRAAEKYRLVWRWADNVLEVLPPPGVAKGAKARLSLREGAALAEVDIPWSYRLLQDRIASRLADALRDLLAC
ncbi:MAG TPA: hypothetical protein PKW66_25460, partial [Polyangiaceae bacterium]|nr:hypothetical protein [Polyangiaceae bacterium]